MAPFCQADLAARLGRRVRMRRPVHAFVSSATECRNQKHKSSEKSEAAGAAVPISNIEPLRLNSQQSGIRIRKVAARL